MIPFLIKIPLPALISLIFSAVIFMYLFSFKNKKPHLNIYTHIFLSFVFSGIFLIFFNKNDFPAEIVISFSFILFLALIITTYKEYGRKLDFYYFSLIIFYTLNFFFYYLLVRYPQAIIKFPWNPGINYVVIILSVFVALFHIKRQAHNKLILYSYLSLSSIYIFDLFIKGKYGYWLSILAIIIFYTLHFSNAKKQVYIPLLNKIEKLKIQVKKQEAQLPEHIRQKFQIMEHNKAKLMDMAYTDKMTGVSNKDKLTSIVRDLINDSKIQKFSILMFDIDNFKTINDNMGHLVGDESLIALAKFGEDSIRKNDYIGRYGGDEFIIILPNLDAYEAKMIAERFRMKISQQTKPKFTISIGVASFPDDGNTFKELIAAADKGLYLSKERGKNRVSHLKLY